MVAFVNLASVRCIKNICIDYTYNLAMLGQFFISWSGTIPVLFMEPNNYVLSTVWMCGRVHCMAYLEYFRTDSHFPPVQPQKGSLDVIQSVQLLL